MSLFFVEVAIVAYEPDDVVKEKKLITLNNEVIPFYLSKVNNIAKENNDHLALGRVRYFFEIETIKSSIIISFLTVKKFTLYITDNMG